MNSPTKTLYFVGAMTLPFCLIGGAPVAQIGQQTASTPVSLQFSGRQISSPAEKTYSQSSSRELKSFMGVVFGESIHQAKFIKLEKVLDWSMMAECKVDNAFGLFKSANVFAGPDGKIHRIWAGWKADNSSTQAADIVKKLMSLISEEIKLEYDQYGMEIVAKDLCPDRWLDYMKCEWGRVPQKEWPSPCVFFCFKNASGNLSQVITLRKLSWGDNSIQLGADLVIETKTGFLSLSDYITHNMIREEEERIKKEKEKDNIPELESFCGISFGSVLKGDLERTDDGRYLTGCVKLKKPFRGVEYAQVYVGIKSRKIFRIVIETNDKARVINDILAKKYNPDKSETIGTWGHFKLRNSSIEVRDKDVFRDVDSVTLSAKVRMVNPENWITTIAVMDALHETYKSVADKEYEEESGGDGSAVL